MHFLFQEKEEAPSLNIQAKESSKEEEVFAICKLKGVDPSAPVSHHLQALDAEYHHLLDTQQSAKADQVQALYAWYSKKVSQVIVWLYSDYSLVLEKWDLNNHYNVFNDLIHIYSVRFTALCS